jgi:carbon monoxide dehydrogenase subunit G
MARVTRSLHVTAPSDRVFALVADLERLAAVDPRVGRVRVERDEAGPRRVRLEFAPGPPAPVMEIVADVTRYVPGREFALASPHDAGGAAFRLDVSCRPSGDGTDVSCEMEIRVPGVGGRMADPLIGAALGGQVDALLQRLEREVEGPTKARGASTGRPSPIDRKGRARSSTRSGKGRN